MIPVRWRKGSAKLKSPGVALFKVAFNFPFCFGSLPFIHGVAYVFFEGLTRVSVETPKIREHVGHVSLYLLPWHGSLPLSKGLKVRCGKLQPSLESVFVGQHREKAGNVANIIRIEIVTEYLSCIASGISEPP